MPGAIVFMSLSCLAGVSMFAYFTQKGCDPLRGGQIKDVNQVSNKIKGCRVILLFLFFLTSGYQTFQQHHTTPP